MMSKSLMVLLLMVAVISSAWAQKGDDAFRPVYAATSFGTRANWSNTKLYDGTATLRDIIIGTKIKSATDDTIRLFSVSSASPRNVMLMTDTSTSSTTPIENRWIADTIYQPGTGFYSAAIGDVDRDGDNDLIFGRTSSPYNMLWKYWTGTGWNVDDTIITYNGTYGYIYDIKIGDANNDGYADEIIYTNRYAVMRAYWNGTSWDTLRLWDGNGTTCYGVAIGDFDASHTGNEIVAVTYGPTGSAEVMEIMWNSGTSSWDLYQILMAPVDFNMYAVEVGDFDASHPGDEIAIGCGGTYTDDYGAIVEVYGSGTSWSYRACYTPPAYLYIYEIDVGDCLDENPGDEIAYVTSTSPYEVRVVYGSGSTWGEQALFSPGGTSYGIDIGDVDKYRTANDEIAIAGYYDIYEAEQVWYTNDLGVNYAMLHNPTSIINLQDTITVSITNSGTAAQTGFSVGYSFQTNPASGSVVYSGTLSPATTDSVKIPITFNTLGWDTLYVYTMLGGDENPANDTAILHMEVYDDSTVAASGFNVLDFPPQGWAATILSGTYNWERYTSPTLPTAPVLEGYAVAGYNSYSASAGYMARLRTHQFDIGPSAKKVMLRFYMFGDDGYATQNDSIYVEYSFDDVNYTTVAGFDRVDTMDAWRVFDVEIGDFAANMDLYIGFLAVSKSGYRMFIDSVWIFTTTATAAMTDAGVNAIAPFNPPLFVGDSLEVVATVRNYGLNPLTTTPVFFTDGGADTTTETWTGSLLIGQTDDFTFSTKYVPSSSGDITLWAGTKLPGDQDATNDTTSITFAVCPFAHVPPFYKDFEEDWLNSTSPPQCGWVIIDGGTETPNIVNNNDWHKYYYSTTSSNVARIYWSPVETSDDWLISPRLDCSNSGGTYTLSYWHYYNDYTTSNLDSGRVLLSTDGGAHWQTVAIYSNADSSGIESFDVTSLVTGQSDVKVAFNYVATDEMYWYVDDFRLDFLADTTGPDITLVTLQGNTYGPGPYGVSAVITDASGILADSLYYVVNDTITAVGNVGVSGDTFAYQMPTQAPGTVVEYYVKAVDNSMNSSTSATESFWVLSPMAPTDLTAEGQADTTVLLGWLPPGEELSYHTGITYYWSSDSGDMVSTQFTPQHTPCKLEAASITFYTHTDTFAFYVWADDGSGYPGTVLFLDTVINTQTYPNAEVFDLSGENIVVDGDFHIGYEWLGDDTPWILCDAGANTTRSKYNEGSGWLPSGYDFFTTAVVSYIPPTTEGVVSRRVSSSVVLPYSSGKTKFGTERAMNRRLTSVVPEPLDVAAGQTLLERILGISNFEVERSTTQGGPYTSVGTTSESSLVDSVLTNETQYYYVVKANYTAPDTMSYYSNEVTIGVDYSGPAYLNTTYDSLVGGPWPVSSDITDWSGLEYDSLGYRADGGSFTYVTHDSISGNTYYYTIPSYSSYTLIEFYMFSQDMSWLQNTGQDPLTGYYAFTVTGINENNLIGMIPDHVFLNQNRPNPFSQLTRIEYGVPQSMHVNISIYNAAGQRVKTLIDETKAPGYYVVNWQGTDNLGRRLAEGVYFMRITTDELKDTRKIIHVR
ncbi:MAG: T9SS type A sorting domain-containing protein [candidate division WOR-3 bacterium]|nr:MAG: T9SS type A sorting domain-containing protein [candidate division WOR-3 bacterium]